MTKIKTITLAHGVPGARAGEINYRVEKITDSTDFAPRQVISKKQVDELCVAKDWKVTIVALGS